MTEVKELLPIGSVVLLKEGSKKIMIVGVKQTGEDGQEYDYLAVLYPEGFIGQEITFLFMHGDIDTVYFRGYEDEEQKQFIEKLQMFYNTQRTER